MNESQKIFYYVIVLVSMLYALYKAGLNKTGYLIILTFWSGLFQYLGDITNTGIDNAYKVGIVLITFLFSWRKIFQIKTKYDLKVNFVFVLFTISFWISYFLYGGGILTILSQYLYKYGFVFILYHYFKDIEYNENKGIYTGNIILTVLKVQVVLSIVKLLFIGVQTNIGTYEPVVGSMSAGGAGLAVVIPIMALIFYWVWKEGKFERRDWYIAVSFIIIAFASAKRQPIVFFPLILLLLLSYVKKGFNFLKMFKYIPLVIILFILGAKLNPTFNPENRIWGSFDFNHVTGYMSKYYFGSQEFSDVLSSNYDTGIGRGVGLVYYFQPGRMSLNSLKEVLFGKGRYEVATGIKGRFTGSSSGYGLEHSGLMGEAGAMLYSFGYVGTILMLLLAIVFILKINDKRVATIIIFYYLWDFLFYYNQVLFSNQGAVIVFFIIFYTNFIYYSEKQTQVSVKL